MNNYDMCKSLGQAHSDIGGVMVRLAIRDQVQPNFTDCIERLERSIEAIYTVQKDLRRLEKAKSRRV